jgi:hydrogenase-4 component E
MHVIILFGILASTYLLVIAKRIPALIRSFRYQSTFLFLITAVMAFKEGRVDLYIVAGLIISLKVFMIPHFLSLIAKRIKLNENLGFFINAQLSLLLALILTYCSWALSNALGFSWNHSMGSAITVAFSVVFIGAFLMISRMMALTQVIGLLVMENGIFLLASFISEGMPFFVEIAIFFDVFVSVVIMGLFVYRINKLFTHIDVSKLSRLRG